MRSVFFYINATKAECISQIEIHYKTGAHGWINDTETIFIDFWNGYDQELEYETWQMLNDKLGENKFICVMADISGRTPGDAEVLLLADHMLGKFYGLAQDDYSDDLWTYEEIKHRKIKSGHYFFDYSRR
jgi:hypothetical protein